MINYRILLFFSGVCFCLVSCSKSSEAINRPPTVTLRANLTGVDPFTFRFTADALDQDLDPLTYEWEFGEGTKKTGAQVEEFVYPADEEFNVKVTVRDNRSGQGQATIKINTFTTTLQVDLTRRFQTMEGFGGFGAQNVYWSNGPFTSQEFVNNVVNDLGITIIRDELPTSFEITNDNSDPAVTDLSRFNLQTVVSGHHQPLGVRLPHLKALKAAGVQKFIASVWSPPPWMKHNNDIDNGTPDNSAPPYTQSPGPNTNQLKKEYYEEFAEMCAAYVKILKQEADIDLYAFSIQNEPRFSQFYQSCVYDGNALRDLLKVVGKRFRDENISTKLFIPEDIGWLQGVEGMVKPSLDDAEARQYADIIAVHGYDLDGVTAASPGALTWKTMFNWGAPYGKPLWMTETSGFKNDHSGAMALAKAMFTAIHHGNVSAWVFWTLSTENLDEYSLMSTAGAKSKRYYASKNFYRYVRPGAERVFIDVEENSKIYPLAFRHDTDQTTTLVLINDNPTGRPVRISGNNLPAGFKVFVTSENDNCKDYGTVQTDKVIFLPANSVVTLQ